MLSENRRKKVLDRILELVGDCDDFQYKTLDDIPKGMDRIAIGEYKSWLNFGLHSSTDLTDVILKNVEESNASSFMGLWFLSEAHKLLLSIDEEAEDLVYVNDPDSFESAVEAFRDDVIEAAEGIYQQLETAAELPKFFQGTTDDLIGCPKNTMGWYPLVKGYRLPAVVSKLLEKLLKIVEDITKEELEDSMANSSDGDIWSWCMTIDDTTPDILRYYDEEMLLRPDIYEPLLGSSLKKEMPEDITKWLLPDAVKLWEKVSVQPSAGDGFPIGTFYGPITTPSGAFSCPVIGNVLAAIPLLETIPDEYRHDIENAMAFVKTATKMALRTALGEEPNEDAQLDWKTFAYDYYTIPTAPIGYIMRAHRRICEIKARDESLDYPDLLDEEALQLIARYTAQEATDILENGDSILAGNDDDHDAIKGNVLYASLSYCFSIMMNLWRVEPQLYNDIFNSSSQPELSLASLVPEMLFNANKAAYHTPGTGPYALAVGYASMASICFVAPPLIEAYCYYLLSEKRENDIS